MDSLHLTYRETVYEIPYRNLVIMSKDKAHVAYGEVYREASEDEFFKSHGMVNPFKNGKDTH